MAASSTATATATSLAVGRPAALGALAYRRPRGGRDVRLDLLRGWCIFSMVVDHAADQRASPLFTVTGNGPWPMTGAHGFVVLSGVVLGILYAAQIERSGFRAALPRLARRAAKLYAVAVALGLFDLAWSTLSSDRASWAWPSPAAVGDIVILRSGSDDLMTFYFLLVAVLAPLALWLCSRGLGWVALGASLLLWAVHTSHESWLNPPFTYFVPVADWQLLFAGGLLAGYHRAAIGRWLVGRRRALYLGAVFAIFAATLAIQSELVSALLPDPPAWLDRVRSDGWQGYDHNPPIHMLAVAGNLLALYHLVTWLWVPVSRVLGWFLIPLGQSALYVYIVHSVLVFYVLASLSWFGALQGLPLTAALLGLMLLLWALVKRRVLFWLIPR